MLSFKKMMIVAALVIGGAVSLNATQAQAGGFGCGYGACHTPYYAPVRVYNYRANFYNHCAPTYYAPSYGYGFGY